MKAVTFIFIAFFYGSVFAAPVHLKNIVAYSHDGKQLSVLDSLYFDNETGRIIAPTEEEAKLAEVIDGKGQFVLPGLHDAHGHILNYGLGKMLVEVRDLPSANAAVDKVKAFAKANPKMPWVLGRGWNHVQWESKSFPTRYQLDEVVNDRPVWLRRVDGHAAWANSKALAIAGINRETAKGNDLIIKDAEGVPTGVLIDNAMSLVAKHLPEATSEVKDKALQLAFKDLLSVGLTFVHEAGIDETVYEKYQALAFKEAMPIRVYGMLFGYLDGIEALLKKGQINIDDHIIIRSVKLMVDGALGSYGAILKAPYSDKPEMKGAYVQTPEQVEQVLGLLVQYDFQANVHAIGDKGNAEVIELLSRPNMKSSKLRHRVEHAQILSLDDIPKFKQHDIIASIQPTHATSDMNMAEDRVGAERIKGAYAWQKLIKSGAVVASGSDFPVELINPFYGLHAAVTRQDRKNQPEGGWYADEAMSVEQALQSFTINAAFAAHAESFSGSLDVGKYADFIVVDQDIFKINKQDIWKTKVLETWVGGQKVFEYQQE
ncbi:amidohydrolase [Marinicella rhabdoformis]|uniref:amidohydrolase n=1 Tax=Marinicella rhabdoformis TaxID=2580566 RepID=UPI0012AEB814|nr:amidohydrolase [Marinicella rhabdoformis]